MTRLRWVWSNAMKRHIIDKGLPVPAITGSTDLKEISSQHLEARAVHAAKFHENWYSTRPKPRRIVEFDSAATIEVPFIVGGAGGGAGGVPIMESSPSKVSVTQVLFLPGRNGEFVVTAAGRCVTCWEVPLDGSGAYRVAEWTSDRPIEEMVVNEDPKHPVQLACVSGDREGHHISRIHTLMLDTFHGTFIEHDAVRSHRELSTPIHAFRGDWIAFGNPLSVWCTGVRVRGKDVPPLIKRVPTYPGSEDTTKVIKVAFIGRFLLVVRSLSIQLVEHDWVEKEGEPKRLCAHLIMGYPAREASIIVRPSPTSKDGQPSCPWPVTVLLRCCDDGFDTIRQYDLLANPKARKGASAGLELPCIFPSQYTRIISVAPSCCDLRVGPNGKGFWIQTRNVTSRHSQYPARCLVGFDVMEGEQEDPEMVEEGQVIGANGLHVCKQELYSRRCDMSEIICKKYSLTTADLEDSVGRIAIGDRHGRVEVLDFV